MYCKHCGNKVEDTAKFCLNCGKQLKKEENVSVSIIEESTNQKKKNYLLLGIGSVVLIVSVIGYMYFLSNRNKTNGNKENSVSLENTESSEMHTELIFGGEKETEIIIEEQNQKDTQIFAEYAEVLQEYYECFSNNSYDSYEEMVNLSEEKNRKASLLSEENSAFSVMQGIFSWDEEIIPAFSLCDINNDKVPELIIGIKKSSGRIDDWLTDDFDIYAYQKDINEGVYGIVCGSTSLHESSSLYGTGIMSQQKFDSRGYEKFFEGEYGNSAVIEYFQIEKNGECKKIALVINDYYAGETTYYCVEDGVGRSILHEEYENIRDFYESGGLVYMQDTEDGGAIMLPCFEFTLENIEKVKNGEMEIYNLSEL